MQISKREIDAVKRSHDLVTVVSSCGVTLKKKGKNYVGLCPFHSEKTPSFTVDPKTNLYHCFGCDAGGDIFGFICKHEGIGFKEAYEKLSGNGNGKNGRRLKLKALPSSKTNGHRLSSNVNGDQSPRTDNKIQGTENGIPYTENGVPHAKSPMVSHNQKIQGNESLPQSAARPPKLLKLFQRVVKFYQDIFEKDPKGRAYLEGRGIKDLNSFRDFGVGYANGSLLDTVPPDGEILADLKTLGILTEKGQEFFSDCIVVPLFDLSGVVTGLYGRRITDQEPHHLYLPGPRRGLINWQAAKRSTTILLTEAIIDALTLYDQGFKNVIPCYGVTGLSEDHLTCFKQFGVKEVMICFDSDEAGKKGAASAVNRLSEIGITCSVITLPDKDVNDYFKRNTPEEFEALIKQAHPLTPIRSEAVASRAESFFEPTDAGFRVGYGDRIYEVKGVHRQGVQLRVTLHCQRESRDAFHLDSVDLYSARARERFSKEAASALKEREELIKDDLMRLTKRLEQGEKKSSSEAVPEPSPAICEAAKKFLLNPNLFDELLSDLDTIGFVGEETIKQIGYIACTSRKLSEPLSLLIQSRSAAGKSAFMEALISLMPPEDVKRWTRLTDQALFYQGERSLVHKLIAVEEMAGMGGAAYSIRSLLSEGVLTQATVMKDPVTGQMKPSENKVYGPASALMGTTNPNPDEEMASRAWPIALDESIAQTERILARQREDLTIEGYLKSKKKDAIMAKHNTAQRMLKSLLVRDANAPSHSFAAKRMWSRRDQPKVLALIQGIAFLHQYQRKIKTVVTEYGEVAEYIEIEESDWKKAEPLIAYLIEASLSELPAPSRALLEAIHQEAKKRSAGLSSVEITFTRRELRELMGWSIGQIKLYLPPLIEQEYLWVRHGKKGQEYRYEIPSS